MAATCGSPDLVSTGTDWEHPMVILGGGGRQEPSSALLLGNRIEGGVVCLLACCFVFLLVLLTRCGGRRCSVASAFVSCSCWGCMRCGGAVVVRGSRQRLPQKYFSGYGTHIATERARSQIVPCGRQYRTRIRTPPSLLLFLYSKSDCTYKVLAFPTLRRSFASLDVPHTQNIDAVRSTDAVGAIENG